MYNVRVIEKNAENLEVIKCQTARFNEDRFLAAISNKRFDEFDIRSLKRNLEQCLPALEFELFLVSQMSIGFNTLYTTQHNDFFIGRASVFNDISLSIKVFKDLCVLFEQRNQKKRSRDIPPGFSRPKVIEHTWLFEPSYMLDAFGKDSFPTCVIELFEVMNKCVNSVQATITLCLEVVGRVESTRECKKYCLELLESFKDDAPEFFNIPQFTDLRAEHFCVEWELAKDKEQFAADHYHQCSVEEAYRLSCKIDEEKQRLMGFTEEEIALFGNNRKHLNEIRYVESNIEKLFKISGKKIAARYVYAFVTWANPNDTSREYLRRSLQHLKETYQKNGGERGVIKLRALQYEHDEHDPDELKKLHNKIQIFVTTLYSNQNSQVS